MTKKKINTKRSKSKPATKLRAKGPVRILAIDPGSRKTGIAIFEGSELILSTVKDFGHQKSVKVLLEMATKAIEDLIRRFQPEFLVIEKTFIYKNKDTSKLVVFANEIKTIAKSHGLSIVGYAPRSARKIVVGDGNATKQIVMDVICRRYPDLLIHKGQTHIWKEYYWCNMFDAVCVGMAFLIETGEIPPLSLSA